MSVGGHFALTPLEIATGLVFGEGEAPELPPPERARTPLDALERTILPALERPPCLVSFSGGRDSSCVLAAAAHLARREGLPLPVPATNRFPAAPDSDESDWQERVITQLGLSDWLRLDLHEELDSVGPVAQKALRRHGLLWPFNAHFHVPLLEAAAGGSLLTGVGGDEVFSESSWARANDVLARRARPRGRDVLRVGFLLAPGHVRRAVLRRRIDAKFPWLTPTGQRAFTHALAAQAASEPRRYRDRLSWWLGLRSTQIGFRSLALLGDDAGTLVAHPLADPSFAAALAGATAAGPRTRAELMRQVFGDLLPEDLYRRRTKAIFDRAFWGSRARELAERWKGEGADATVVEESGLRAAWSEPVPDPHTLTLLQAAWLELNVEGATESPAGAAPPPEEARSTPEGGAAPSRAAPRA